MLGAMAWTIGRFPALGVVCHPATGLYTSVVRRGWRAYNAAIVASILTGAQLTGALVTTDASLHYDRLRRFGEAHADRGACRVIGQLTAATNCTCI